MFNQFVRTFGLFIMIISILTFCGVYYLDSIDKNLFFVLTLMMIFGFGGIIMFLVRNMFLDIKKVTKNIETISGDNYTLLKIENNDEVGQLANSINKLNEKFLEKSNCYENKNIELRTLVGVHTSEFNHLNDTKIKLAKTVIDLTMQKKLEKKYLRELEWRSKIVKSLVVEAKKIDQQKSEFSLMISHELKTQLTSILNWCSILEQNTSGTLNSKQPKIIAQKIKENTNKILTLNENVLDARKLDLDKMTFIFSDISSLELTQSVYDDYEYVMKKNNIEFNMSCEENFRLVVDKDRIKHVLKNFLTNAIDFVSKNGKIEIYTKRNGPYVTFCVKDNGIGISKEKQKDLFKKFYQVDISETKKHGDSGLGLSIDKEVIENMNGLIGMKSELGKGSIFYFSLPISKFVVPNSTSIIKNQFYKTFPLHII